MRAMIQGSSSSMLTVSQLKPGTLFKVNPEISDRVFVKCGNGLSENGNQLAGANAKQPPVFAVIVPTQDRFDQRAFTPATSSSYRKDGSKRRGIDGNTPVISTHGTLVLGN